MPKRRSGAYLSIGIACIRAGERPNAVGTREGKLGSAEVRRQTFLVAVHRVRRSGVDKKRQTEVISKMLEANQVLYLELQIVRFW